MRFKIEGLELIKRDSADAMENAKNLQIIDEKRTSKTKVLKYALGAAITGIVIIGLIGAYFSQDKSKSLTVQIEELEKIGKTTVDVCKSDSFKDLICQNNLNIPRHQMPQVQGKVLENYLEFQRTTGVKVETLTLNPSILKPIQKEMHAGKIVGIIKAALSKAVDACSIQPILVALDSIIDGHHRYAACSLLHRDLSVMRIDKNASTVLEELKTFPGVTYESL
jgi:hypothetical protein